MMADGKRGRRPDSDELKAAKKVLKAATTEDARAAAQAEVDAIKESEKAGKANVGHNSSPSCSEDEKFDALVEYEPRIRELERLHKEAGDNLKAERDNLSKVLGGATVARKKLDQFRRAQTEEGEAEAREFVEMHQRVAAWRNKPLGYIEDLFSPPPAAQHERQAA